MNFLIWGDPHLSSKEDLNRYKDLDTDISSYDAVFVVGDVVDPIPRDRANGDSDPFKDIDTGRSFFQILNEVGKDHGIPSFSVSGNHDHDIHREITEDYEHVINMDDEVVELSDFLESDPEQDYTIIGNGAQDFNLHPEIVYTEFEELDPSKEDSYSINEIEDCLLRSVSGDLQGNDLAEIFDLSGSERAEFKRQYDDFLNNYGRMSPEVDEDNKLVYLSHQGAFNTDNDWKEVYDADMDLHWGSMSLKAAMIDNNADLVLHGHHHNENGFDYRENREGDSTYVIDPGKHGVAEAGYEGTGFRFRDLV